ncbi:pheromone binding protein [Rhyzopertha dominica]|nr:pheromone binding protein [Rhyzopertha dominica]
MLRITCLLVLVIGAMAAMDESLLSSEARDQMYRYHRTCVDRTRVDEEKVRKTADGEFPDDDDLKCFFKCTMIESGAMNEQSGDLSFEPVKNLYPENLQNNLRNTFDTCKDQNDDVSDLCEKAFGMFKCFYRTNSENYIVF